MPTFPLIRKFTGGLDRDSDARLIKEGDYYYALNMRNISSEGSTEGVIETIKGTTEVSYTPPVVTTGANQVSYIYVLSNKYLSNYGNGTQDGFIGVQTSNLSDSVDIDVNVGVAVNVSNLVPVNNDYTLSGKFSTASEQNTAFSNFVTAYSTLLLNSLGVTVTVVNNLTDPNMNPSNLGLGSGDNTTYESAVLYGLKFEKSSSFLINIDGAGGSNTDIDVLSFSDILNAYQNLSGDYFTTPPSLGWRFQETSQPIATRPKGSIGFNSINAIETDNSSVLYRCIGTYENTQTDKVYYFLASLNDTYKHLILEYDIHTSVITTVFRDCGDAENAVFNWRKEFLINDIDMIGDKLYWTSPFYGEPKGINVRKSKNSIALMDAIVDTGVFTGLGAYTCVEQDPDTSYTVDGVTVYPSLADYYPYQLYDNNYPKSNKESYVEVIKPYKNVTAYYFYADDPSIKRNNVIEFSWQFRQRYHFYDKEVSAWGPASSLSFTSDTKKNSSIQASPGENNHIAVRTYYGNGEVEFIEICARKNSQNGDNRGDRKKGNQGEYFSIAKVKNNYKKWLENNDAYTYYHFYNDKIYSFISQLESDKNYDNVPKNALTQTLLGNNRLAYGNYFEGFDLPRLNVKLRPLYGYLHTNEFDINTTFYPFFTEDKDSKVSPDNTESSINSFGGVASGSAISSSDLYTTSANNLISILQSDLTGNFLEHLNYFNLSNPSSPEYQWLEGATEANNFTSTGSTEHWTEMQSADNVTGGTDALTAEGDIPGENGTDLNMVNYDFATVKSSNSSSVIANYTGSPNVGSQTNVSQLNSYDISETPTNNPLGSGFFTGSDAGGENNYPKIRLTFKMNFDEFVFRPNVRLKLKWAFKVQKEYRSGGDGWFDQTPTQVMDIDIIIPQVPGNYTGDQCKNIADYLSRLTIKNITTNTYDDINNWNDPDSDKPEQDPNDYEVTPWAWHKRPFCYAGSDGEDYLVMEWCAPKKNVFSGNNPPGLTDNDYSYRLVAANFNTDNCNGTSLVINHPYDIGNNGGDNQVARINYNVDGGSFRPNLTRWHLGQGTYKSAAFHSFGLIYYDKKGRASTVAIDSVEGLKDRSMKVYVKGQGQRTQEDLWDPDTQEYDLTVAPMTPGDEFLTTANQISFRRLSVSPVTMQWKLYHKPPSWAHKFRFAYAKNTSVSDFCQFRLGRAKIGSEKNGDNFRRTADGRVYVHASSLLGSNPKFEGIVERDNNNVWNPLGGLLSITTEEGGVAFKGVSNFRMRFITKGWPVTANEAFGAADDPTGNSVINTAGLGGINSIPPPQSWNVNPSSSIMYDDFAYKGLPSHNAVVGGDYWAEGDLTQTKYIDVAVGGVKYIYFQDDDGADYSDFPFVPSSKRDNGWWIYFMPPDESGYRIRDIQFCDQGTANDINEPLSGTPAGWNHYENAVVELYRTEKGAEKDQTIYYEWGNCYDILDINGEKYHAGQIQDQTGPYNLITNDYGDIISNVDYQTSTPAMGVFSKETDCFMVARNMKNTNNDYNESQGSSDEDYLPLGSGGGESFTKYYVEDYSLNDFARLNHTHIGRFNVYSPFARNERRNVSVTWSDIYQPDVGFNGLSSFNVDEGNWKDFERIDGSVQKIQSRDSDMILIQEDKTYRVPVDKNILMTASGQGQVGVSSDILGTKIPYWGQYGISKNPESFVANGNVFYWVDIKRGAVLRLSRDGFTVISDANMADYFRDKSVAYKTLDPQYNPNNTYYWDSDMLDGDHKHFRILGGFNPKHNEYIITFPLISTLTSGFDGYTGTWDGTSVNPEAISETSTTTTSGETISWSERQNRWITFYSHVPDYYGKGNKQFISWKEGKLYLHDDNSEYNNFYGTIHPFNLDFYFNGKPSMVKGFKTMQLEANQAKESNSAGTEESTNTGYEVTLITELGETTIDRNNWDEREAKQYAVIPYNSSESVGVGGEYIGIGVGTINSGSSVITLVNDGFTDNGTASITLFVGTTSDSSNSNYGDQIYYADPSATSSSGATLSNIALLGTVGGFNFLGGDNEISLSAPSGATLTNKFFFIKRQGVAEGDRMKGRYMKVQISKTSKQLIELFTAGAVIQNSELSDD